MYNLSRVRDPSPLIKTKMNGILDKVRDLGLPVLPVTMMNEQG